MKLRIARHTEDLQKMISFYTEHIGLEVLGSFQDHDGYDGVFIGSKENDWHLEFTRSKEAPHHDSDEDDLLVFYSKNDKEYDAIIERLSTQSTPQFLPKNPYWKTNASCYLDPDGFRVIIAKSKV
jgi:catechol 2,3-dioxygenase-like lactoylglutathione lyase family enzyme